MKYGHRFQLQSIMWQYSNGASDKYPTVDIWVRHSIESAQLRINNGISITLDSNKVVALILDLSVAFDTTDYDIPDDCPLAC